jgi:hypothetical protein
VAAVLFSRGRGSQRAGENKIAEGGVGHEGIRYSAASKTGPTPEFSPSAPLYLTNRGLPVFVASSTVSLAASPIDLTRKHRRRRAKPPPASLDRIPPRPACDTAGAPAHCPWP